MSNSHSSHGSKSSSDSAQNSSSPDDCSHSEGQHGSSSSAPRIEAVSCVVSGVQPSFLLQWHQHSSAPIAIVVTDDSGQAIPGESSDLSANGGRWQATVTLDPSLRYWIQLLPQHGSGFASNRVALLFMPVSGVMAFYDGLYLSLAWQTQPATEQTRIELHTSAGVQVVVAEGSATRFEVAPGLRDSPAPWWVNLTPLASASSGPTSDPLPIASRRPSLLRLQVVGSAGELPLLSYLQLALEIAVAGDGSDLPALVVAVMDRGTTIATSEPLSVSWQPAAEGVQGSLTAELNGGFDCGAALEVVVRLSGSSGATGPSSSAVPLLLLPPAEVAVVVAEQGEALELSATITPASGAQPPTGNLIAITGPERPTDPGQAAMGCRQQLSLAGVVAGGEYRLYAAASCGVSSSQWLGAVGRVAQGDGPNGSGVLLITSAPQIDSIEIDAGLARISWSALDEAAVRGYQLSVSSGGRPEPRGEFSTTIAELAVAGHSLWFTVAGLGQGVTGPSSRPVQALASAPTGATACWAPAGGCTLSWEAPAGEGAAGYRLEIRAGDQLLHSATTSDCRYPLPTGLPAGPLNFRVAAVASAPVRLRGPWSRPQAILSSAPAALRLHYDGATLHASWAAVPAALGYRLTLLAEGEAQGESLLVTAPAAHFALPFDPALRYSLAVQAQSGSDVGPAALAELFQAGLYPQFAADQTPALIPAVEPSMAAHVISIGLPALFTTPPDPAQLPCVPPFTLLAANAPYAYQLDLAGTAEALPWSFDGEPMRADLLAAYRRFLLALESIGATPAGLRAVQAAIAGAMPQSFAETLRYAYGLAAAEGYVDLLPGMALRVEYEAYQTLPAGTPDQARLNGYTTSAVARYPIASFWEAGSPYPVLDPFIGALTGLAGTTVYPPQQVLLKQAGAGGLIDSGYAALRQPLLRLVYPQEFADADSPGAPIAQYSAMLLAAASLQQLEEATIAARAGLDASPYAAVFYFRGRATLVPEIAVSVDGASHWLPLGTTLGDLLASRARAPASGGLPLVGIGLTRGPGAAPAGLAAEYSLSGTPLRVDWVPAAHPALLALPLLGGDCITLESAVGRQP